LARTAPLEPYLQHFSSLGYFSDGVFQFCLGPASDHLATYSLLVDDIIDITDITDPPRPDFFVEMGSH
jgi:hypothetical protein